MTPRPLIATSLALILASTPVVAADGFWDRLEDRIDHRESIRDQAVDHGPRDVIEDRLDRLESRADRAGYDRPTRVDRWERRSLRRWWNTQ